MIDERMTMTERMSLSAMKKFNTENTPYSYKSSILLESLFRAATVLGNGSMKDYVTEMLNYYVSEDGSVRTYKIEDYSMDQIRMGNLMLRYFSLTGDTRYKKAVDMFYRQLQSQPRTPSGGFWHKKGYPNQMWLDGLYMQGPFYASYCLMFGDLKACLDDIVPQFELIYEKTLDASTGLLRHAWDQSCKMPWCEFPTGRSKEVWSRAMGWYVMAIADLLEIIPDTSDYASFRKRLLAPGLTLAHVLLKFQDKESGMWYQVADKGGIGKNYLENSATSMFIYFFAKMHRLGFLEENFLKEAKRAFEGMCGHSVTAGEDGEVFLHDTCQSAGLGCAPESTRYRPADFIYYTEGEPRVSDNLHGVAPFIAAALELEFPAQLNSRRYSLKDGEDINCALKEHAGRDIVVIPCGNHKTGPIDIPSHTHLVFEDGAVLDFTDDFNLYPPVYTRWEGVNCWAMHPCLLVKDAEDVVIEGPGTLDGHGEKWWNYILQWKNGGRPSSLNLPIEKTLAALNPGYDKQPGGGGGRPCQFLRPPLLQTLNSKNIRIQDLKLTRSPFWTCHPVCTTNLVLHNLTIVNPYESPNTDGIDIESCVNVYVKGCDVNVGDDGIAVKSGSGREMMKFPRSENIFVESCTVRGAHGGFVIGSETASGVKGAFVRRCSFLGTDRGIRIKTRRGRGGHITDIKVSDVFMDNVICPVSINMFYRCGNDDPRLYSLQSQNIDEDTPFIGDVVIERVKAVNCRSSAAFLAGLPEVPLSNVHFRDCDFEITPAPEEGLEAEMCRGIPDTDYRGIRVINADATFDNVTVNASPAILFEKL